MPNNNQNSNTSHSRLKREDLIYASVFVLYFSLIILLFTYSVKFLGETINTALSDPQDKISDGTYGQLDLNTYASVSKKLKLEGQIINNTSTETLTEANSNPSSSEEILNIETRPIVSVMNSTLKSGLASKLKAKLENAGYTVLKSGNLKPVKSMSVIYIKESFDLGSKYLLEIQKIVSEDYDFTILPLKNDSQSDIEIIIGNK